MIAQDPFCDVMGNGDFPNVGPVSFFEGPDGNNALVELNVLCFDRKCLGDAAACVEEQQRQKACLGPLLHCLLEEPLAF